MNLAWLHCFSGIAGDMALGSLIDAGADVAEVETLLRRLPVGGWTLEVEPVLRAGLAATRVRVVAEDDGVVRTYGHISGLVEEARLPERVRARAQATFAAIAEVEGRIHRRPPAQVHFHEVGAVDSIVDVVGTCAALEVLDVDQVWSSAVATGTGMVRSAHGVLPNPAPAVVALLAGIPTYGRDVSLELTTPTGAGLLSALSSGHGPLPPMRIGITGYGAGTRELDGLPNVLQVVLGESVGEGEVGDGSVGAPAASAPGQGAGQPVVLLEANVDDATGEVLAHVVSELMEAGALDAWITPILMKKGRPAHTVSVLTDPSLAAQLGSLLTTGTGSLGVRGSVIERWPSARQASQVEVEGLPVRVKVSPGRVKVEQADAARVAARRNLPLREVISRAEQAWRQRPPDEAG